MNNEYMKNYMKERGLKIGALADVLECVPQTIYNTFYGKRHFSMEEALKLKSYARMSDAEFNNAFSDEKWYSLYKEV